MSYKNASFVSSTLNWSLWLDCKTKLNSTCQPQMAGVLHPLWSWTSTRSPKDPSSSHEALYHVLAVLLPHLPGLSIAFSPLLFLGWSEGPLGWVPVFCIFCPPGHHIQLPLQDLHWGPERASEVWPVGTPCRAGLMMNHGEKHLQELC